MAAPAALVHRAELELACDHAQAAAWVIAAISPELADAPGGSGVDLSCSGSLVSVCIEAASLADLRASVNNVMRLLDAAHGVAAGIGGDAGRAAPK